MGPVKEFVWVRSSQNICMGPVKILCGSFVTDTIEKRRKKKTYAFIWCEHNRKKTHEFLCNQNLLQTRATTSVLLPHHSHHFHFSLVLRRSTCCGGIGVPVLLGSMRRLGSSRMALLHLLSLAPATLGNIVAWSHVDRQFKKKEGESFNKSVIKIFFRTWEMLLKIKK